METNLTIVREANSLLTDNRVDEDTSIELSNGIRNLADANLTLMFCSYREPVLRGVLSFFCFVSIVCVLWGLGLIQLCCMPMFLLVAPLIGVIVLWISDIVYETIIHFLRRLEVDHRNRLMLLIEKTKKSLRDLIEKPNKI